ncbi:hypothetical protein [Cylindrospermopsis raciborskii]|uniref:hypothetical protein n=1 Tax=Cylindrospermopsis raciborskii TaxID=77022 RepID=UPI00128F8717|nr:hypothetical protein [Cylindrospermopsis raciborskii]
MWSPWRSRCECFANALDIPLPLRSQGKFVNMVNERSRVASALQTRWEYFVNALPWLFSRENLKVVNRTISHSDCSAIALLQFFSREWGRLLSPIYSQGKF